MNDILKVFLLNSRYLFNFVEERYLTKEDVINFMNINSKFKKEILSYYERSFKLEFPNLIKIKNKDYLTLFINFKLSKIPKNVINCIDLDLKLHLSRIPKNYWICEGLIPESCLLERIIFISPNVQFTNEKFDLTPTFEYMDPKILPRIDKYFFMDDAQNIFTKEISEIHRKIFKSLVFFDYSHSDKKYKLIYESFGFYPFDLEKFKNLESSDIFKCIEGKFALNSTFSWDCFSKDGLRVISEKLLTRIIHRDHAIQNINKILKSLNVTEDFETIFDKLECKESFDSEM